MMGVTIHYRGTIDRLNLIETFEDRVLDLAFAMGGKATIWRSFSSQDPSRIIRGLILEMAAGQESMSLLISPEGQLINLFEIEDAEKQPLDELPYCSVKTQFGSVQGHIAIVHLLAAMKKQFFSDLDIQDESGYHEHRDVDVLRQKIEQLNAAIKGLAEGLNKHGLSSEALEDPEILATRIERIAMLVQQKIAGAEQELTKNPSAANEKLTTSPSDLGESPRPSLEQVVAEMELQVRQNRIRSEQMVRSIQESVAGGKDADEALQNAILEFQSGQTDRAKSDQTGFDIGETESSWPSSQNADSLSNSRAVRSPEPNEHPALRLASEMLMDVFALQGDFGDAESGFWNVVIQGLLEIVGGMAQATSEFEHREFEQSDWESEAWSDEATECDQVSLALKIVQLKRAIRGHSFARGGLFGLGDQEVPRATIDRFHNALEIILSGIQDELASAWSETHS